MISKNLQAAMITTMRFMLAIAALFIFFTSIAFSQTQPNIEVTKLKEHFYRLTCKVPYSVNFLAYVRPEGILLVDSGQKETGAELKSVLKTIALGSPEVKILINTHAHIDHTGGNLALAGGPIIIGPEILRSTLRDYSYVLYEFPDSALPSVTFADSINVYFGDEKIRVIATPGSHDATDVIVHFTKAGIVCLGDISYGMTFPTIDGYTGNLLKYPEVIDRILTLIPDDVTIVSGHGRETSVSELKQFRDMLFNTAKLVKEGLAQGKDVATMQNEDILKDWASFEGGFGGNRKSWIAMLAIAGPPRYRGSTAGELYRVLVKGDADAAIQRYRQLKRDYPNDYPFSDYQIIRTGYWLLDKGRTQDAIKLFGFCVNEYPNSANGYDSLAEAYMKAGDKELAIKNYEKSLQLNPRNKNAEEMLKQLRSNK
jgi:glyoxylase-like metal-dependent hydrolase (beta-lactamase superfamily II)